MVPSMETNFQVLTPDNSQFIQNIVFKAEVNEVKAVKVDVIFSVWSERILWTIGGEKATHHISRCFPAS